MKIDTNMYVRTNDGYIAKYDGSKHNCNGKYYGFDNTIKDIRFTTDDDDEFLWENQLKTHIIKSSYNIMDLIEERDYVRIIDYGDTYYEVVKTPYNKLAIEDRSWSELEDFENDDIASIITHEQMERMEYKVNEL